jgi:hypothetical protein
MPNVFTKRGSVMVYPRPRPLTAEAIRATEAEYRRRFR